LVPAPDNVLDLDSRSRLVGVGVHDALTASLVAGAGFDLAWVGSFEASTHRRIPDVNLLTYTEMAEVIRAVRTGCRLPILVDADNGYGSDECALRALEMFRDAGATATCIEDNLFPKQNSLYSSKARPLEEPGRFVRRLEKLAGAGTGVKIIARTEALVAGLGPDEAVRRLKWYANADVDALFVQTNAAHAAQLPAVLERVSGVLPLVVAPTALPDLTADEFHDMGAQVVLFANVVCRTTIRALTTMLAALGETRSLARVAEHICDLDEAFDLTGAARWNQR
jgi:phosphoenolpyruvate phosphomutase